MQILECLASNMSLVSKKVTSKLSFDITITHSILADYDNAIIFPEVTKFHLYNRIENNTPYYLMIITKQK